MACDFDDAARGFGDEFGEGAADGEDGALGFVEGAAGKDFGGAVAVGAFT